MLRTYLNAIHGMETEVHKKMMYKVDRNTANMYQEFEKSLFDKENDSISEEFSDCCPCKEVSQLFEQRLKIRYYCTIKE